MLKDRKKLKIIFDISDIDKIDKLLIWVWNYCKGFNFKRKKVCIYGNCFFELVVVYVFLNCFYKFIKIIKFYIVFLCIWIFVNYKEYGKKVYLI